MTTAAVRTLGIAAVFVLGIGVLSAAFVAPGAAANTTSANASTSTVGAASVTLANQTTNGTTVTVRSVTLPEGGFIAIHNESYLPPSNESVGSTIGVSQYLSAGSHQRVEVVLDEPIAENQTLVATAARDGNGNQTFDYVSSQGFLDTAYARNGSGGAVDDQATIRVVNATSLAREAKIAFENQSTAGQEVTVRSVTLPDGGFVAVHGENYLPPNNETQDSLRGVSGYLTPGTHENVTVPLESNLSENATLLAAPYQDTNRNQTFDFVSSNGENDTAYAPQGATALISRANVTVGEEPQTSSSTGLSLTRASERVGRNEYRG